MARAQDGGRRTSSASAGQSSSRPRRSRTLNEEPLTAGDHLTAGGRLVDALLAATLETEVLDRIRDVDVVGRDAGIRDNPGSRC